MKKYFLTGLLVWIPIGLIYLIAHYLFIWMNPLLLRIPEAYRPEHWVGFHIPLIEWLFTFVVVLVTGFAISNYIGYKLLQLWKRLIKRIPFVNQLFHATERIMEIFMSNKQNDVGNIVLVEFPRRGMWRLGFQMGKPYTWKAIGKETITVLFPTCPEPSSGVLAIAPMEQVIDLDMTLSEGIKTTFSFGILQPQRRNATISANNGPVNRS